MATVEELRSETVQMMKYMAVQITKLVDAQAAAVQNTNIKKTVQWDRVDNFKNIKIFSGDSKEWDEFATKFRSQAAAGGGQAAVILDAVETELKEEDIEEADW